MPASHDPRTVIVSVLDPAASHCWPMPLQETPENSQAGKSGPVSFGVPAPFSWALVHTRFCLCPLRVCFSGGFWVLLLDPQDGKSVVGPRTSATMPELIWYNFSPVYQLSAHGSIVELIAPSSKRTYTICYASQVCCSQSPCPCGRSLLTRASARDTQTLKGRSGSVSCQGHCSLPLVSSEHLWQVWDFVLNAIAPVLPSCWGFAFALGQGVSFFGGIQHSPVNGCSASTCDFGVLTGEDEPMSLSSTILY